MQIEKKYFKGVLDADSVDILVPPDAWVNAENVRYGTTDAGVIGTVESVGSNTPIESFIPSLDRLFVFGHAIEEARNRIVYFRWGDVPLLYAIYCFDFNLNERFTVIDELNVVGGLGFDEDHPIHSARIVNGILYWVDALNEGRSINIDAWIATNSGTYITDAIPYISPVEQIDINLIKTPPALSPNIQKDTDGTVATNFIANDSFMFAFSYVFYTNEESILGTFSPASRLNKVNDTFNRIVVTMDSAQTIPQTVRMVNLWVRFGTSCVNIKTWDKDVAAESAQIDDQNNGISVLTYNFYNNVTGQSITEAQALKPFDSIPRRPQTLEVAKNRLHLGGGISGYDTPLVSSLSYMVTEVDIEGATALNKNLIEVKFFRPLFDPGDTYSGWYVFLNAGEADPLPSGYYAITATEQVGTNTPPPLPAAPVSITPAALTFRGLTQTDVLANLEAAFSVDLTIIYTFTTTSNIVEITGTSISAFDIYKTNSPYKIAIVFYDFAMRKCAIVNASELDVFIPPRPFELTTGVNGIVWTVSNTNALNEIPDWAYYYTVVRTLNLRTRFFIQSILNGGAVKYATKDANGVYVFTDNTFVNGTVGLALSTISLVQAGLGYTFAQGDVCLLTDMSDVTYTLPVIGQFGNYIILKPIDLGDVSVQRFVYEIYSPYQTSTQEPFYEVGNMYSINNPGTVLRQYGTLSDILLPDSYALSRNFEIISYFAETMSPNDFFYARWDTDAGKVNLSSKLGDQEQPQTIRWSNTFIAGTMVNGLSTFEPLNFLTLPQETGAIQKLQLTSKVQNEQGVVMLAINTVETCSMYLEETQILDATGTTQFFASSEGVIGTVNVLKGSYGTRNPESVTEYRGYVFWLDIDSDRYIRYSLNGLFPISEYRMSRFWKLWCTQFKSMTRAQFTQLGSRPFVFSAVDPRHDELLISIPKLLVQPPRGYLPDYPNVIYPFDIYDGQAKTLVFKIQEELSHWQGAYTFYTDQLINFKSELYSAFKTILWLHNQVNSYCNFYQVQYKSKVMFIANQDASEVKSYNDNAIEGNMLPTFTYFRSEYPWEQGSDLADFDWENKEGVFYCFIYRNRLTPSATGHIANGLIVGEKMRTTALRVLIEWTITTTPLELKFYNIGYTKSLGHTVVLK